MKYKHVNEDQIKEYFGMDQADLITALREKFSKLDESKRSKATNSYIKDLAKEISDFQKKNTTDDLTAAIVEVTRLKEERDTPISDDIDELKDLRAGFDDSIKAFQEHVDVLIKILSGKAL